MKYEYDSGKDKDPTYHLRVLHITQNLGVSITGLLLLF